MNAHTRFALPVNTHGNLKYLHDGNQADANSTANMSDSQSSKATASTPPRDSSSSKVVQKMKMLFPGEKTEKQEDENVLNERKRSTTAQLVGSHAFVQMGRR
ncbi:hypothetical protein PHMEG_00031986 [Phytophthora megakarya]|uniref:Uncharacterized protein n=1 Tax=Phytophthora megakarya TaxID=4795 RepID=A0A225UX02_9STRA|nr:hypothetical protein PHMEG_00031986 [Phytophthora megakarya]